MIQKTHASHQGAEACIRRARETIFWSGMRAQLRERIERCDICKTYQPKQQREPLMPHPTPTTPWSRVSMDLMTLKNRHYLITVDTYSDYWELDELHLNSTAKNAEQHCKDPTIRQVNDGVTARVAMPKDQGINDHIIDLRNSVAPPASCWIGLTDRDNEGTHRSTLRSFDNRRYDFQGPCRYTFAKDCDGDPDFTVEVQNVDGTFTHLPYHEPAGRIEVHQVGRFVRVRLVDSCVEVFFDGSHQVRVTVPRTYVNDMCGLCGNFNDDPSDDLNGLSEYDFGTSHLTDNATCPGGVLPPEVPVPDCNDTYEAQVSADDMCGLISDADGPFAICHGVVDPQIYFDNCVYDMCAGAPDALCQNMEAYAVECVNEGVPSSILDWRTEDRCPRDCPANSFWSPCATSCPATCVDPNAPDHCLESCVEGCQCEDGFIDSGGACVPSTDCGCVDHYGFYHPLGEVWDDPDNAGFECECTVDGIICGDADGCDPDPCDPNAVCTDVPAPGTGATCTCNTGYEGDGYVCTALPCPYLMAPANGALSPDGPYVYLDVVTFTCDEGYSLNGASSVTCLATQLWSDVVPTCDPNGALSPDGPYVYLDVVTFTCDPGYELAPGGASSAMCLADQTWSADVPTCQRVECPTRMAPVNGAQAPQGPYYYEDVVTYSCDTGYELVGASSVTCQADTTWSAPVPTCERVECPYRMAPANGAQSSDGPYYYGDVVTYSCDPGYELVGPTSATCQSDESWSADVPTCQRVECPYRMAPVNGAQSSEGPYFFGDEVTYSCDEGYELAPGGASSVTCQADETWSADVPTCQRVECPYRMAPENGAQSSEGPYYYEDVVTYSCDQGYGLNGASSVTCQADQTWSATVPTCNGAYTGFEQEAMTRDDLCVGPDRGYCHACGDPHYRSFDRRPHHFQGPCRYIFAKDCGNNDFSVEVQQVPVPRRPVVSVVREVFVIAHGYEIGIHQGNDVTVDGVLYTLPFSLAMGKIRVRFRGIWVHVHLVDLCVDIYYNGRHCVKVKVSAYYYDRMCGLCGNFNNDRSDDFMMSDLVTIATNWNDFGFSWLVQDEDNELCIGPPDPPICPPEMVMLAEGWCRIITANNGPFAPCHAFEDPSEYFHDCVFDVCLQDGDIVGLCDNLEAYADACDDKGVHISWRTPDLCPLPCPPNSHYNPCASPCPPTCQDPNPICIQVCVECCECDAGYIMSGPHCVPIEECGCTDPETGRYYELGETWVQNGRRCECRENNNIVCKGCSFDIVFILDRSSSIGPYGMYIAEKYIAYIIRCLFGVDVEVGYIVFDCISKWLIALGLYTVDTAGLIPQIKAAEFTGGISRSGNAIRHFSSTANFRNGIPKAAIVLTDGRAYGDNPDNLYQYESDAARAMGIEMYAVAVGREYYFDYNALTYIAGGADRVFGQFSCCALAYRMMCDLCVFPPPCDANADLFFVLDGSGSVGSADFATVKDFVVSVVSAFTISLTDTRVGVVQYSSSPHLACNLGQHPDQQSFVDAITNMVQIGGGTNTGAALAYARTTAAWRGSPFPKIMIVLTDGQSGDSVDQASLDLANDGIIVFAIGVGNFDAAELQQITNNNSDRVFELADFETLTNSIDQIVEALCNGATP
ncbi:hypothetical protein Bbelb_043780 [Branchiostoma belcheri]|nr:hypothetical protein Bbelb_043780 [Branchiostoma belcheri]